MENSSTELTPTPPMQPKEKSGHGGAGFWFLLILILLLGAGLGFTWQQARVWREQASMIAVRWHQDMRQQGQTQQALKTEVQKLSQQLQTQQQQMTQTTAELQQALQATQGSATHWKIAEAIYLVRLANLQLTVNHSIDNALFLLKQADRLLSNLNNPALQNFHQAIMKDLALLQAAPQVDIGATAIQLADLRDQVDNLSILVAPKPNTSVTLETTHQQHKKWWQRAWDNIKASLQQLVIVRHQDDSMPALMSPDQQAYLRENLQLLFIQAQWALLHHQASLYQSSLHAAKSLIEKFYVQNSATTQNFLKQLELLRALDIAPPLPDLTQALTLANQEAL